MSLSGLNLTQKNDSSILYEKEASFVAVLDDHDSSDTDAPHTSSWRLMDENNYQQPIRSSDKSGYRPWSPMTQREIIGGSQDLRQLNEQQLQDYSIENSQLIDRADILNYDRLVLKFTRNV